MNHMQHLHCQSVLIFLCGEHLSMVCITHSLFPKFSDSSLETEEKKLQAASTMSEAKAKQAEKRKARKEHVKEKRLKRRKEFERLEKMYDSDNSGRENDDDSDFEMSDIEEQLSYHMSEQVRYVRHLFPKVCSCLTCLCWL